MRMTGTWLP
jgi:2-oxoisovalerate dehydrogenase E1 component beta subunit